MHEHAQYTGREATQPPGEWRGHYRSRPEPSSGRFFSNVWRDRQGAAQMHLSTR